MSELKRCPFCGGETELKRYECGDWQIICYHRDGCIMREDLENGYFEDTDLQAVIRAWNTRTERTCHDDNIGGSFVCSECGANVRDTYVGRSYVDKFGKRWYATSNGQAFNFCPNCGAKVIGG